MIPDRGQIEEARQSQQEDECEHPKSARWPLDDEHDVCELCGQIVPAWEYIPF